MNALIPSIPTKTAAFNKKSLTLSLSPQSPRDNGRHDRTLDEMLRSTPRLSNPGASPLHILNRLFHVVVYVVQLQSRGDSLLHPCRSPYHRPHTELAHFRVT